MDLQHKNHLIQMMKPVNLKQALNIGNQLTMQGLKIHMLIRKLQDHNGLSLSLHMKLTGNRERKRIQKYNELKINNFLTKKSDILFLNIFSSKQNRTDRVQNELR